jgi:cellulose synthase/poly-beta-1,6-N-acetylglucosamine synthase-like glycosyltransferase
MSHSACMGLERPPDARAKFRSVRIVAGRVGGLAVLTFVTILLALAGDLMAMIVAVPVAVLLAEIVAAIAPAAKVASPHWAGLRTPVAVLVPAHNESLGVRATVEGIAAQLSVGDRLLVVADNCTDDTAAVAAAAGAEVIQRHDPTRIGKGYALDWGLLHLRADPPDIVIMVDADCSLGAGAITTLASACLATGRPAQALDLMIAPDHSAVDHRVAEFAWRVKNWARPLGLRRLGLPCQLMGTGMAFPWSVISAVELATGHIVEDLRLGLDLALAGRPAVFCPSAVVTSHFPVAARAAATQRERWEYGQISMIALVPRLLWRAAQCRNGGLAVLVLDMVVPPLALLALLLVATLVFTGAAALLAGSYLGLWLAVIDLAGFLVVVLLAWLRWGRDILPAASVRTIGFYLLAKLALYRRLLRGGATWVRTARTK